MDELERLLNRLPAVRVLACGVPPGNESWWAKIAIDIAHPLAWRVVQELAHVLNSLSVEEPLPTIFKPVSPPPYMNGGPQEFLSWVIEPTDPSMNGALVARWLASRLPQPIDDEQAWLLDP